MGGGTQGARASAQEWDKLAWGPCAKGIQAQPRRQAPSASSGSGSGRLVPGPHCLGSQQPQELSAGSTATSGGRRRESQLGGPAARLGHARLADRANLSQSRPAPDQPFSGANPCPQPSLSASNKGGSLPTTGIPSLSVGLAGTSQGSLV